MTYRLRAMDAMRGLVVLLMVIDHSSLFVNADRFHNDASGAESVITSSAEFFTRWVTHLCAPTFVFLAGTALAMSTARRRSAGEAERVIDMDIAIRGALILLLDVLWISLIAGHHIFQVLYVLGG